MKVIVIHNLPFDCRLECMIYVHSNCCQVCFRLRLKSNFIWSNTVLQLALMCTLRVFSGTPGFSTGVAMLEHR